MNIIFKVGEVMDIVFLEFDQYVDWRNRKVIGIVENNIIFTGIKKLNS